jgi:hypothetical protein
MSTRIDTLDPALVEIFQEPEVIAIDQDFAGEKQNAPDKTINSDSPDKTIHSDSPDKTISCVFR